MIQAGTTSITRGDDNSQVVSPGFSFPFHAVSQSQVTISTNGLVLFSRSGSNAITRPALVNGIAAYNQDLINTAASGSILYRTIRTGEADLTTIQNDINRFTNNFAASNVFVITYNNIQAYADRTDTATFQIIMTTGSTKSFIVINYNKWCPKQH